jgi:hypothetical protein
MNYKSISIESINKDFSALGGLKIYDYMYNSLKVSDEVELLLPRKKKNNGITQKDKFKTFVSSFLCGADCLDDLEWLRVDTLFKQLNGGGMAAITGGDFLRSFNSRSIEQLQAAHISLALKMRKAIKPNEDNFELSIDSTPHIQTARKMEGLEWDYKRNWGLNSQNAYDQFGFSYGFDLRPGATYSGNGAGSMIRNIFNQVGSQMKKYLRGDSAYCNLEVMNSVINQNGKFALAMRENVYKPILRSNKNTMKWKKTRLKFFDSDQCEISNAIYAKSGLAGGLSALRVVFIRAPKTGLESGNYEDFLDEYRYFAIATNIFQHEWKDKKVIDFYRKRANCENFIKEQKYGMDFKHFPCKKLNANKVYGLIGSIAYNMMRMSSFLIDRKRGCLSKKIRKILLEIPCQLVSHARRLTIKMNHKRKEVFDLCYEKLKIVFRKVTKNST